jgi:hypothetical protein
MKGSTNIVYRIDYPEYFTRGYHNIDFPEICSCPWNFKAWLLHNNVLDPILGRLNNKAPEANVWNRKDEFSMDSFSISITNGSYYEDDIYLEISLKKPLMIKKIVKEIIPAVMEPGVPYQPETTKIVAEYEYPFDVGVFCVIALEAKRYLE